MACSKWENVTGGCLASTPSGGAIVIVLATATDSLSLEAETSSSSLSPAYPIADTNKTDKVIIIAFLIIVPPFDFCLKILAGNKNILTKNRLKNKGESQKNKA
jgi:hypothetical protein